MSLEQNALIEEIFTVLQKMLFFAAVQNFAYKLLYKQISKSYVILVLTAPIDQYNLQ